MHINERVCAIKYMHVSNVAINICGTFEHVSQWVSIKLDLNVRFSFGWLVAASRKAALPAVISVK